MSKTKSTIQPMFPSRYFHVFNRGINKCELFYTNENYRYLLRKCNEYMDGYWDLYAWALMGNHFHFLVRVRSADELRIKAPKDLKKIGKRFYKNYRLELDVLVEGSGDKDVQEGLAANQVGLQELLGLAQQKDPELEMLMLAWSVSERFRRCLMGYAKAINKQEDRTAVFSKMFLSAKS